jgi:hypothetical protein
MPGPLNLVRSAFADRNCRSVADIQRTTGLSPDVLDAALDHLLFTGELTATALASGCPADACATCAVAHGCPASRPATAARSLSFRGVA